VTAAPQDDEFGSLDETRRELGLDGGPRPRVRRERVDIGTGGHLSAVLWGDEPPQVVFLHGGGQNARTWDLVALLLGVPALAFDLPGHGHSAWRDDHDYRPERNADAVAAALAALGVTPACIVGMSLGGLSVLALAGRHPAIVRAAVMVDVSPESGRRREAMSTSDRGTTALMDAEPTFGTLDEAVELAAALSPGRPRSAVRRGLRNNMRQLPDGRWTWRYDTARVAMSEADTDALWDHARQLPARSLLVRGGSSAFVPDADLRRYQHLVPALRCADVPGAGHAVQSDQPAALARILAGFMAAPDGLPS
jgi:pimeloyl-ACP methyl ester carboxylesterase